MATFLHYSGDLYKSVTRYAVSLAPNADTAHEAVHSTLMTILDTTERTGRRFTKDTAAMYWFTAVKNKLFPSQQAVNKLVSFDGDPGHEEPINPEGHHDAWNDFIQQLLHAIDDLPEPQRDVLLRVAAGQTEMSITRELDVPRRTIRWRLERARQILRGMFNAQYERLLAEHPDATTHPVMTLFTPDEQEENY